MNFVKGKLPKTITHREVHVRLPREFHDALLFESGRTGKSMGDVLLGCAWTELNKLPRRPSHGDDE
jgi:hypothetical protein